MVKDITAILVYDSDQALLFKALTSLKIIRSRLKSIVVVHELRIPPNVRAENITFVSMKGNDCGQLVNDMIDKLDTAYVLFLHNNDYLSPTIHPDVLNLPDRKDVLGADYYNGQIVIRRPVLVRAPFLKRERLPLQTQLPFKEAMFPAWLANVKAKQQLMRNDLLRQAKRNRSANTLQKENIMQKYQFKKTNMHPTISVIISTYNMEKYVDAAVTSCLLQNETFEQILIMDDGSTDNSYERLQHLGKRNNVKVYRKKNEGKAKALNELLEHVTSHFILELDADDWLDPDACSIIKKNLSGLPNSVSVLYGNLRKWKQLTDDIQFKSVDKGIPVGRRSELFSYRFPLGPRIYRTSTLKKEEGFFVSKFEEGRLYEDVSTLYRLLKKYSLCYKDFTVYNVREHSESITKNNVLKWNDFLRILKYR